MLSMIKNSIASISKIASGNLLPGIILLILPFLFNSKNGNQGFDYYLLLYVTVIYCQILDFGLSRASFLLMKNFGIVKVYFKSKKFVFSHILLFVFISAVGVLYFTYVEKALQVSHLALFSFIFISLINNFIKNILDSLWLYATAAVLRATSILLPVICVVYFGFSTLSVILSTIGLMIVSIVCVYFSFFYVNFEQKNSKAQLQSTTINTEKGLQYSKQASHLFLLSCLIFVSNYFDRLYLSVNIKNEIFYQYLFITELIMRGLAVASIITTYLISSGEFTKKLFNWRLVSYCVLFNFLFLILYAQFLFLYVQYFKEARFTYIDTSLLLVFLAAIFVNTISIYLSSYLEANGQQRTRILILMGSFVLMIGCFMVWNISTVYQAAIVWLVRALYELWILLCVIIFKNRKR